MDRWEKITRDMPWPVAVAAGYVVGWSNVILIGHDAVAAQANAILAPANATDIIKPSALLDTAAAVKVSSTDSSADDATGTGANTILLAALDANGDAQTESVNMHATDGKLGTTTSNTWTAINAVTVTAVGSGKKNAGTIWVGTGDLTSGVPAVGIASVEIGHNRGLFGVYTVPLNHELHVATAEFGADGAAAFKGADFEADVYSTALGKELELFDVHIGDGGTLVLNPPFLPLTSLQQLILRGGSIAQTCSSTFRIAGYLRDLSVNSYSY